MRQNAQVVRAQYQQGRTFSSIITLLLIASLFVTVVGFNSVAGRAFAQTEASLADVVPSGSVLFMEVDLDQNSDQWVQTFELLDRAGLSDVAEQQLDASPEQLGEMAEMFAVTGRAALVFTSADAFSSAALGELETEAVDATTDPTSLAEGGVPEGFAVVFDPADPQALYEQLQTMVADEADEAGATLETTDYNGTTIEFWTSSDETTDPTAIAMVGENVVLSIRPSDIEPIIDTVNGEEEALSTNENFNAVLGAFDTPSLTFGYANGEVIADQLATDVPELAEFTERSRAYFGWNAYVDESGFRLDTVTVPAEGADLVTATPFDPTFAQSVPADTLFFLNGNNLADSGIFDLIGLALQGAMSETGTDIDVTPVSTPTIEEVYAQLEDQLGFNLQTDLFDQLNGEFAVAVNVDQIFSEEPVIDAIFIGDVADERTVADVGSKISFILASGVGEEATVSEREVPGGNVTSIAMDPATTGGLPVTLEYGVIDGQLLIGVNNGIDSYLEGPSDPLADDPAFQDTMEALPQENIIGIQYLNLERLLPMIEEAASTVSGSTEVLDNDLACEDYASQEEAQAAYDEDPIGLWNLDLDYDGEACEDFFGAPASSPAATGGITENINLVAVGTVSYTDGDLYRTSTILLVGE